MDEMDVLLLQAYRSLDALRKKMAPRNGQSLRASIAETQDEIAEEMYARAESSVEKLLS